MPHSSWQTTRTREAAESAQRYGAIGAARAAKARFKAALETSLREHVTRADLDAVVAMPPSTRQPGSALLLLMELMLSLLGLRPRHVMESVGGEYVRSEGGYRRWVAAPKTARLDYWVVATEVLAADDALEQLATVSHDSFSPQVMVRLQHCFRGGGGGSRQQGLCGAGAGMMPVALRAAGCDAAVGLSTWLRAVFDATAAERAAYQLLTRAGVSLYHVRGGSLGDHRGTEGMEEEEAEAAAAGGAAITPPYAVQAEPISASVNSAGVFIALREAPGMPNLQLSVFWPMPWRG